MGTEPVRRILKRQLQRIAAAGDTDGTATEIQKGRHMAAGARRLLQRGTIWATEADIEAAAKAAADERRAKDNECKRARRKHAAALKKKRNSEPHANEPPKAAP